MRDWRKAALYIASMARSKLRAARDAARLTQAELARRLGVTASAVSQWETAETTPGARQLLAIAAALGISPADALESDVPSAPPSEAA